MAPELHTPELIIRHAEILARISEQVESTCTKLVRIEKQIETMFSVRDRELLTAKAEMERRLAGVDHLNEQLLQTRADMGQKIGDLSNAFLLLKEGLIKQEGKLENLNTIVSSKNVMTAQREGKQEGMTIYQIIIMTGVVSVVSTLILHFVFKF